MTRQHQEALRQKDQAIATFWRLDVQRAAEETERARAARCVEKS